MFFTLGLFIMPPDKVEVEPCFVVAALISRAQAQDFARKGESTRKPYFPVSIGFRRFKEPTNVSPNCPESIRVPTMVWGREASAKRSQQRPLQ